MAARQPKYLRGQEISSKAATHAYRATQANRHKCGDQACSAMAMREPNARAHCEAKEATRVLSSIHHPQRERSLRTQLGQAVFSPRLFCLHASNMIQRTRRKRTTAYSLSKHACHMH